MPALVARVMHVPGFLGVVEGWAWWVSRTDLVEPLVLQAGFEQSPELAQALSAQCRRGWEAALSA